MRMKISMLAAVLTLLIVNLLAQPALQWQKNLGGSGNDKVISIQPTKDGGFIVAGQSDSNDGNVSGNHGKIDFWVSRLDGAGNIKWQKSLGGSEDDIPASVKQTSDGGFIVAGISSSADGDVTDHGRDYRIGIGGVKFYDGFLPTAESWIVKLDSNGAISWNTSLHVLYLAHDVGNYLDNYLSTIVQLEDSSYVYGGTGPGQGIELFDYQAMIGRISKNGLAEIGYYSFPTCIDLTALAATSDGFVATGNRFDIAGNGGRDIYVKTYDKNLAETGNYDYGGSNADVAYDVQALKNGGFIVAGSSASSDADLLNSGNHGGDDFWLLKLKNTGEVVWSKSFGRSASDVAKSVQQLADGSFIATGSSFSADGQVSGHSSNTVSSADYWLIKTDSSGNLTWSKSFGGTGTDEASCLKVTPGGFIVAGSSSSTDAGFINKGKSDYWLLNFNLSACGTVPLPVACNQAFCSGNNPMVANLVASGVNLKWYNKASGGSPLSATEKLISGTYYVTQTIAPNCESGKKTITVTVSLSPAIPITCVFQVFCKDRSPKVANLSASGTSLKWYRSAAGGSPLSPSQPLVTGCYYVSQTSAAGCESKRRMVIVIVCSCRNMHRPNEGKYERELTSSVSIYPNPARDIATIKISTDIVDKVTIQVIDVNGKTWLQQSIGSAKTAFQKTIDVSKFPAGFYALKYIAGEETGVVKFQVIR